MVAPFRGFHAHFVKVPGIQPVDPAVEAPHLPEVPQPPAGVESELHPPGIPSWGGAGRGEEAALQALHPQRLVLPLGHTGGP